MKPALLDDKERRKLLETMWASYKRQKALEADAGVDVEPHIEKMRKVFKMAADGSLHSDDVERMYPEPRGERKPGACGKCESTGKYFSHDARFRFRYGDRRAPAIVVCDCFEGQRLREAIKKMGLPKKRGQKS